MKFIGHNKIRESFDKLIEKCALSHAHLIIGEDGIGKSKIAQIFALSILDKGQEKEYADIVNYRVNEKSIGIDEVRGIIQEIYKKPFEGDKKVIIIHKGNKLTIQAQNALLKTIEEPPKGVYIIILCESGDLILDTIKSRCQIHKLSPLNIEDMREYINLYFKEFDEKMINSALAYAGGVPGKVEDFFNNKNLEILRGIICNLLVDINKGDKEAVIAYEKKLASFKENWEEILNILLSFIRDISVYKEVENKELIINGDKLHEIDNISREMTFRKLKRMVKVLDRTRNKLNSNTNFLLTLNVMIIDLMEV